MHTFPVEAWTACCKGPSARRVPAQTLRIIEFLFNPLNHGLTPRVGVLASNAESAFNILNESETVEGVLFIPDNRPRRSPELLCADCGRLFRPRQIADGVELLCDRCYVGLFQPRHRRNGRNGGRPKTPRHL